MDITSTTNPKIKWLYGLHSSANRRKEGLFLVEGSKEIALALDADYELRSFFICPEISKQTIQGEFLYKQLQTRIPPVTTISQECFAKVAYRSGSDGVLAVFKTKNRTLDELNFGENPFFIVVEAVEKPGNLGAILRTADGAQADAVIICDEKTDVYNPNVIRASVGTLFSKQVVTASNASVYDFLEKHEIAAYGAVLDDEAVGYTAVDFTAPCALLLGAEHQGLSDFWKQRSKAIMIPMLGVNDSLNVSNAATVLAYEVVRQRSVSGL